MVARDVAHLHGDTLELARLGNNLKKQSGLTEKGQIVPGLNDYKHPRDGDWEYVKTTPYSNRHEVLTGSQTDGRAFPGDLDYTCNNWTSSSEGSAMVGHFDRQGGGNTSWNAAHQSRSCSQADLIATGGDGLFYCFAAD